MAQPHLKTQGSTPLRFQTYLEGLKVEFDLMAHEIESLRKERDDYKAELEVQAKALEDVRHKVEIYERYRNENASAPQIIPSSQPKTANLTSSFFSSQTKSLDKRNLSGTSYVVPSQQQGPSARLATKESLPHSLNKESQRELSTSSPESGIECDWSITFNDEVEKEVDVEMVHTLFLEKAVYCVKFSQDGKYLAVACADGKAYIYDVQTGILTRTLRNLLAEERYIESACFSPDGKYLANGAYDDNYIYMWEIETKYVRNAFKGHTKSIRTLDFSPNGRTLVSASWDNTVRLWDMRYGAIKTFTHGDRGFLSGCPSAVFSPDGKFIAASSCTSEALRVWDAYTGQLIRKMLIKRAPVYCVAFMPDGNGLVTGSYDCKLRYWDMVTSQFTGVEEHTQPKRVLSEHEGVVYTAAITRNGQWVASASGDQSICIRDTRNGAMKFVLKDKGVRRVDFSPAGSSFLIPKGSIVIDFSPAGSFLASGGNGGKVRIWRYTSTILAESEQSRFLADAL